MPHVGVHLSADVFELIHISAGNAPIGDGDASDLAKRVGVEKTQLLGAIAENESFSIAGQTPTLARVPQGSTRREAREVVDERNIRSPCQLHKLAVPFRQPFGEIRSIEPVLLDDLAGFELDLSQRRLTIEPSALEEEPVTVDQ